MGALAQMSQIHVSARLAVWSLAVLASSAGAQGSDGGRAAERRAREQADAAVRTEREIKLSIELPPLPSTQCEAVASTSYQQRNTVARFESTIKVSDCAAAAGEFTVTLRIRDDAGGIKMLELDETWQRSDDQDVSFTKDYPIGENVELVGARMRGLSCACVAAAESAPEELPGD
jgi:hypothetical protein